MLWQGIKRILQFQNRYASCTITSLSDEGCSRHYHGPVYRRVSTAVLLQEDVKAAVEYAEGQIRRLLSGQVELWELPLTGGLWRVTGDWLEACCE